MQCASICRSVINHISSKIIPVSLAPRGPDRARPRSNGAAAPPRRARRRAAHTHVGTAAARRRPAAAARRGPAGHRGAHDRGAREAQDSSIIATCGPGALGARERCADRSSLRSWNTPSHPSLTSADGTASSIKKAAQPAPAPPPPRAAPRRPAPRPAAVAGRDGGATEGHVSPSHTDPVGVSRGPESQRRTYNKSSCTLSTVRKDSTHILSRVLERLSRTRRLDAPALL